MTFDTNTNIDWSPDGATGESLSLQSDVPPTGGFITLAVANDPAEKGSPIHPLFGHWLRPELSGQSDRFQHLSSFVFEQIVAGMNRKRGLKQQDAYELRRTVDVVIANALGAFWHRVPKRVAYFRRHASYADKLSWPEWLSAWKLAQVVSGMSTIGYLLETPAQSGQASQFEATATFVALSDLCGITANDLGCSIPRDKLIRLKDECKRFIPYVPTSETEEWADRLSAYNTFIGRQQIGLEISEAQERDLIAALKEAGNGAKICRPELFNRSVYRVFNDGRFDHGGRLYGAWWQSIPREFRQHITINGEPTVELDYAGFALRSIYHQTGIDLRTDPYELAEVCAFAEEQGFDRNHFRSSIKALTQALINAKTGKPERIPLDHSFCRKFTRKRLFEMLMEKHDPIRWAFASGEGIKNQKLESDIALEIITFLTQSEVPVLSIHDSFIVKEEDQFILGSTMDRLYFDNLGFHPVIT